MEKPRLVALALVLCSSLFTGCGISVDTPVGSVGSSDVKSTSEKKEEYSYEFQELNWGGSLKCTTDKHTFTSLQAYCDGLKSYDVNHEYMGKTCAMRSRADAYAEKCSGTFEETDFTWSQVRSWENGKDCTSGGSWDKKDHYAKLADFCAMLRNHEYHHNCSTSYRKSYFQGVGCTGQFE
jgi:hypothetical protein